MAKKFGGFLLFGLAAGAAAAGVYHYLQNREKELADIDDFDDLDNMEEEEKPERSYVNLENVKTFATETFDKAKEVAKDAYEKVSQKVQEVMADKKEDAEGGDPVEVVKDAGEEKDGDDSSSGEDFFNDSDDTNS